MAWTGPNGLEQGSAVGCSEPSGFKQCDYQFLKHDSAVWSAFVIFSKNVTNMTCQQDECLSNFRTWILHNADSYCTVLWHACKG
jgi:hypothetical protein